MIAPTNSGDYTENDFFRSFFEQVAAKKEPKKRRITGRCPEPCDLFEKRSIKNFRKGWSVWWRMRIVAKGSFACSNCLKTSESCLEIAKNADFSTFSKIKVLKSSLLFAKVVLLYKVRNFAEHLRKISTIFVFNKIL